MSDRPIDARGEAPCVTLDGFLEQPGASAVRLEPDEDARALIPHFGHLSLVEVSFPTFRDGRGFSAARILREAGYRGELRAAGDIILDQIAYLTRCGFDSFAPDTPIDPDAIAAAQARWPSVYQRAADAAVPIWALRHG